MHTGDMPYATRGAQLPRPHPHQRILHLDHLELHLPAGSLSINEVFYLQAFPEYFPF